MENITGTTNSSMDLKYKPGSYSGSESDSSETGIRQTVNFEGKLTADPPVSVKGEKDLIGELPPDMRDFLETLGGKIKNILRWDLKRNIKK